MNKQRFINILKKIIKENFQDNVSEYARAAEIPDSTLRTYLKRGSRPNPDILTRLARAAGMSIAELYPEGSEEQPAHAEGIRESIIRYEGPEMRRNWPYTHEEQSYIEKFVAILRGKNKKNIIAIKKSIDAFYATRDVNIPGEIKKQERQNN